MECEKVEECSPKQNTTRKRPPLMTKESQLSLTSTVNSDSTQNRVEESPAFHHEVRRETKETLVDLPTVETLEVKSEKEPSMELDQQQEEQQQSVENDASVKISENTAKEQYLKVFDEVQAKLNQLEIETSEVVENDKESVCALNEVANNQNYKPLDCETPLEFYHRTRKFVSRKDYAKINGLPGEFYDEFRRILMEKFNFCGLPLDSALRLVAHSMAMPPESQQVDRFMKALGDRYHECNPNVFPKDCEYPVCFAIFMLNTTLYNKNMRCMKKLGKEIFFAQLREPSVQLDKNVIMGIFYAIKRQPIKGLDRYVDQYLDLESQNQKSLVPSALNGQNGMKSLLGKPEWSLAEDPYNDAIEGIEFDEDTLLRITNLATKEGPVPDITNDGGAKQERFYDVFGTFGWQKVLAVFGFTCVSGKNQEPASGDALDESDTLSIHSQMTRESNRFDIQSVYSMSSVIRSRLREIAAHNPGEAAGPDSKFEQPYKARMPQSTQQLQNVKRSFTDVYSEYHPPPFLYAVSGSEGVLGEPLNYRLPFIAVLHDDIRNKRCALESLFYSKKSPLTSDACLLHTFYASLGDFPIFERRLCLLDDVKNVYIESTSKLATSPQVFNKMEKIFDEGLQASTFQSPTVIYHGPLMQKHEFKNKFDKSGSRSWHGRWFLLVVQPILGERAAKERPNSARAGRPPPLPTAYSQTTKTPQNKSTNNPRVEMWIYEQKAFTNLLVTLQKLFDKVHPNKRRMIKNPFDLLILANTLGLPKPTSKLHLDDCVSFVDYTYSKYDDAFRLINTETETQDVFLTGDGGTLARKKETDGAEQTQQQSTTTLTQKLSRSLSISSRKSEQLNASSSADFTEWINDLFTGFELQQKVQLLGGNKELLDGSDSFTPSDRHHWVMHLNASAAIRTTVKNIRAYITSVTGKELDEPKIWSNIQDDIMTKIYSLLPTTTADLKQRYEEFKSEDYEEPDQDGSDGSQDPEEEFNELLKQMEELKAGRMEDWSQISNLVRKFKINATLAAIASDIADVENLDFGRHLSDLEHSKQVGRLILVLVRLQFFDYTMKQKQLSECIHAETCKINQLELSKVSFSFSFTESPPSEADDEASVYHDVVRIDKDLDAFVLNPGSTLRRTVTSRPSSKTRPTAQNVFQLNTANSSVTGTGAGDSCKPASDEPKTTHDPPPVSSGGVFKKLKTIKQAKTLKEVDSDIDKLAKSVEWNRILHEKYRIYRSIIGRCLQSLELYYNSF